MINSLQDIVMVEQELQEDALIPQPLNASLFPYITTGELISEGVDDPIVNEPIELAQHDIDFNHLDYDCNDGIVVVKNITNISKDPHIQEFNLQVESGSHKCVWKRDMVRALIDEYTKYFAEFRDPTLKQRDMWYKVASNLCQKGIQVTGEMCDRKWRNLKNTYQTILYNAQSENKLYTGNWEFYNELSVLFSPVDYDSTIRKSRVVISPKPTRKSRQRLSNEHPDEDEQDVESLSTPQTTTDSINAHTRLLGLTTLTEVAESQNVHYAMTEMYIDQMRIQSSQNIEFLNNDSLPSDESEEGLKSSRDLMPPWFQDFIEEYRRDEQNRLQMLQTMHNEYLEVEKKKVNMLELLVQKLS